ncbi:DUF1329 domain-containing protein [Tepidicaulis sp. LMO-SS28]|uniref:DUF1329 domain-containing protein n=1 Tax=Tepidicaulis sp. LMO-SS28 TaxID=3447455 RepID=UPI003EE09586
MTHVGRFWHGFLLSDESSTMIPHYLIVSISASLAVVIGGAAAATEFADRRSWLTPVGADRSAGLEKAIPPWTGGLSSGDAEAERKTFVDENHDMVITIDNFTSFNDKIGTAQFALFENFPESFSMKVYPSRRTCGYPQIVYESIAKNAHQSRLTDHGNGVSVVRMGFPFPLPSSGLHILWNHILAYRGYKVTKQEVSATPTSSGDYTLRRDQDYQIYALGNPNIDDEENNIDLLWMREFLAPARIAGGGFLFHNTINQVREPRRGWFLSPQERRVKKVPTMAYDNAMSSSDGIRINDTQFMFNGAPDKYNWTLLGRKAIYIPYNTDNLAAEGTDYGTILQANHLNPEHVRYELHRVWVVEGRLKSGENHIYGRRIFYFDEDSWLIVSATLFDARGELSAAQEAHVKNYTEVPLCVIDSEILYDFSTGRYDVRGLKSEEPAPNYFADELTPEMMTPSRLKSVLR